MKCSSGRTRSWLVRGLGLAAGLLSSCQPPRTKATHAQCREILGRIVELELQEQGYHDPVLVKKRTRELERHFDRELENCVGQPLPTGALSCVHRATSAEAISHRCLALLD